MEAAAGKLVEKFAERVPIYKGTVDTMLKENHVPQDVVYYINLAWDQC